VLQVKLVAPAEDCIEAGLVAFAPLFEPSHYIGIQFAGEGYFDRSILHCQVFSYFLKTFKILMAHNYSTGTVKFFDSPSSLRE
jgi:hypothetical protein